jgi:hypothetical protein
MIPHAIDGCNLGGFKNCFYGNVVDTLCWTDCMNERITLECIDSCEIPNRAICNIDFDKPLPVELIAFTSTVDKKNVLLSWSTASENNNLGFDVERKTYGKWSKVGFVKGENSPANYTYVDKNLNTGNYGYRLKQTDFNGNFEFFELNEAVTIGVPDKFFLEQNYPNPFNPVTTIAFGIPQAGNVELKVFDMSGREVMTLVSEFKDEGYYTVKLDASGIASGAYVYRLEVSQLNLLESDNFISVKKMVLLK